MAAASVKDVFEEHMPKRLRERPDVVAKIASIYQFDISGPGGGQWWVDCTAPGGAVSAGHSDGARCRVSCSAADFLDIVNGQLKAQLAFLSGRLKIQGDIGLAMKLEQILT